MTNQGPLLCDMHRVESRHLRGKLQIAMRALEVLARCDDLDAREMASSALSAIEGEDRR